MMCDACAELVCSVCGHEACPICENDCDHIDCLDEVEGTRDEDGGCELRKTHVCAFPLCPNGCTRKTWIEGGAGDGDKVDHP
jgi:hypothetical protein